LSPSASSEHEHDHEHDCGHDHDHDHDHDRDPHDESGGDDPGDFELPGVTFVGAPMEPSVNGPSFGEVPNPLIELLGQVNGFVAYGGGLHVRGVCDDPDWHSLEAVWRGEHAFHRHYESVEPTDVPFAQDCVGDQFLLRDGRVLRLLAEQDDVEPVAEDLDTFLTLVQADPDGMLGLPPLDAYREEGESLQPGELLGVWPPFCAAESADGVSVESVPVADRLRFLADLAKSLRNVEDGATFESYVEDDD
jgi:hypothetical protein